MSINSIFRGRIQRIHLVGIGGIGMSGIARVLISSGFNISGSDLVESTETRNLQALGAQIFIGHQASHIGEAQLVVFSSAVKTDNPELICARNLSIPIIPRALMLAELMRLRCGIAIAGTHGKTTTTSLIGTLMHALGLDPTVVIGGIINHFGTNAIIGDSQFIVTEADESDGTFLHLAPTIAVVTNIDADHLDYYQGGIDQIREQFSLFLNALPFYGLAVVCSDDIHIQKILATLNRRVVTYGFNTQALYSARHITHNKFVTNFDLYKQQKYVGTFSTHIIGNHNILNTLAAIAVLEELGIDALKLKTALSMFNGVKRRFTPISVTEKYLVIDDYAHHPTEIKAVLKAARSWFNKYKIRVLFQPHRYTRTHDLMHEFSNCFNDCDSLVITDIYGAQEQPITGIDSHVLIKNIYNQTKLNALHATDIEDGARKIAALTQENDVILTLGAGSITNAGPRIVELLKERQELLAS
jgi:UDP-N-acetylmuramate--alanine ligase